MSLRDFSLKSDVELLVEAPICDTYTPKERMLLQKYKECSKEIGACVMHLSATSDAETQQYLKRRIETLDNDRSSIEKSEEIQMILASERKLYETRTQEEAIARMKQRQAEEIEAMRHVVQNNLPPLKTYQTSGTQSQIKGNSTKQQGTRKEYRKAGMHWIKALLLAFLAQFVVLFLREFYYEFISTDFEPAYKLYYIIGYDGILMISYVLSVIASFVFFCVWLKCSASRYCHKSGWKFYTVFCLIILNILSVGSTLHDIDISNIQGAHMVRNIVITVLAVGVGNLIIRIFMYKTIVKAYEEEIDIED